ncbi:unnamed protein product [Closterium sp. NIES-53]
MYLDSLAAERDLTGGFRGNQALATPADKADWDEQNVDGASKEAGPLPYCSVPIPMNDENPRESVNAEVYYDFADNDYVTSQPQQALQWREEEGREGWAAGLSHSPPPHLPPFHGRSCEREGGGGGSVSCCWRWRWRWRMCRLRRWRWRWVQALALALALVLRTSTGGSRKHWHWRSELALALMTGRATGGTTTTTGRA